MDLLKSLKCCLNPKVIGGLAVVAVGVLIIAPHTFGKALPLLLGLICPLSMIGMVVAMTHGTGGGTTSSPADTEAELRKEELDQLRAEVELLRRSRLGEREPTKTPTSR